MLMYDNGRMETPHSRYTHLFALLRYDEPVDRENWQSAVSVIKVFTRRGAAEAELQRLTSLNAASKCIYAVQTTRLMPE
jgi:hypothetical protein